MTTDQKIDSIYSKINEQGINLARFLVLLEQHRKEIDDHDKKLESLESYRNKAIGAGAIIGVLATSLGAGIMYIIKNFHA